MIKLDIKILYQDKDIAVCVKPPEAVSQSPGMPEKLSGLLGGEFFCVHRLDKGVGGVMVYARNEKAAAKLYSAPLKNKKAVEEKRDFFCSLAKRQKMV